MRRDIDEVYTYTTGSSGDKLSGKGVQEQTLKRRSKK